MLRQMEEEMYNVSTKWQKLNERNKEKGHESESETEYRNDNQWIGSLYFPKVQLAQVVAKIDEFFFQ